MEKYQQFWCFRLGAITRKISREYNTRFLEFGITLGQSFVLFDLLEHDGAGIKDIAGRVQLDSPAVTGLVDRLSRQGLVERIDDPSDRRSVKILLTEKGKELAGRLLPIAQEYNSCIKDAIDSLDVPIFERSLTQLEQNL
ncbi:MAG: MarR family winged helix-turn-helix transcriptional regulator [Syntrophomonadaceae bacterium]|jgi:DNA-binding MarR family transcriptional regulator|nr:MarR family transcriptional regulator [Syntrophomonadaceae bacterium]